MFFPPGDNGFAQNRTDSGELLKLSTNDAYAVFGWPDDLKLRSSMTLFSCAAVDQPVFQQVLDKYYGGEPDEKTLALLGL